MHLDVPMSRTLVLLIDAEWIAYLALAQSHRDVVDLGFLQHLVPGSEEVKTVLRAEVGETVRLSNTRQLLGAHDVKFLV